MYNRNNKEAFEPELLAQQKQEEQYNHVKKHNIARTFLRDHSVNVKKNLLGSFEQLNTTKVRHKYSNCSMSPLVKLLRLSYTRNLQNSD